MKKFTLPNIEIMNLVVDDIIKTSGDSSDDLDLGIWQSVNQGKEVL